MKKLNLAIVLALGLAIPFIAISSSDIEVERQASTLSAGSGFGGGSVNPGREFDTPRGFGEESSQDEYEEHEREFNESAPGAWSNDPEPGKDKPSPF